MEDKELQFRHICINGSYNETTDDKNQKHTEGNFMILILNEKYSRSFDFTELNEHSAYILVNMLADMIKFVKQRTGCTHNPSLEVEAPENKED